MTVPRLPKTIIYQGQRYVLAVKPCCDCLSGGDGEYSTPADADQHELAMGVRVEMEHTTDPEVAQQIALDHLTETPDYYTRLQQVEPEDFD